MNRKTLIALTLAAVAAVTPVAVAPAEAAPAVITDLGINLTARDMNARGVVVGEVWDHSGFFRWKDGRLVLIGDQGVAATRPEGVNRAGVMVVWTSYDTSIRYDAGAVKDLGSLTPSGNETLAQDINDDGVIVGSSVATDEWHAFAWERGKIRDLGTLGGLRSYAMAINNHGQILGSSETAKGETHVVIWQDGGVRDLGRLAPNGAYAADINDKGQITGSMTTAAGKVRAFVWTNGTMTTLPPLPGDVQSSGAAINGKGEVAGVSSSADGRQRAVVWSGGKVRDLGGLGGFFAEPVAINDDGTVAGNASDPSDAYHAVIWTR